MRNIQKAGLLLTAAILATGLTGCADSVTSFTGKVETTAIGEGSGSGDLKSEKKSFTTDEFDSIQVDAQAMKIYVTQSSSDAAEVELLTDKDINNRFTFDASVDSRTLNISVEEESKSFDFSTKGQKGERKLLIGLPDKMYEQVSINNDFGVVDAADIKTDSVEIKVDAGEIRIDGVSGKMQLETNAGQIDVKGISLENDLSASADVGEINIHLKEAPKAAELNLQSEIGEVKADLEQVEYSENSANKKVGSIGSSGVRLDASTNVGEILVDTK